MSNFANRLLVGIAIVAAAASAGAAQTDKPAAKRPGTTERAKPDQKNSEPKREKKVEPPKPEPSLEDRANGGDLDAQYQLGEQLRTSGDVALRSTALMWYGRAADRGHEGARMRLAEILKRYAPDGVRTAADSVTPVTSVPPGTSRETAALGMSVLALVVSIAAIAFSWIRTRRALRDAGLL